jgi:hypothetical protein
MKPSTRLRPPVTDVHPPQPCLAPCPTCGQGQVLVRTYDMQAHIYRTLPAPLTPLLGQAYQCTDGGHVLLATPVTARRPVL